MKYLATASNIIFLQSGAPVELETARTVIMGRQHWMLIGQGWWQIGLHGLPMPEIVHPVTVIEARFLDIPEYIQAIQAQEDCFIHELTVTDKGLECLILH